MTVSEIKCDLENRLSSKRYTHSLAVADMAKQLASLNNFDENKAYLAGLIHDCMREYPKEQTASYCQGHAIRFTPPEQHAPNLWHAVLAVAYIRERYDIHDEDILNAVRYHTTGRAGMSLLERIVYVADCTSADRNYSDVDEVRSSARRCLDDGVRASLMFTVQDLTRRGLPIHPDTLDAVEAYCGEQLK